MYKLYQDEKKIPTPVAFLFLLLMLSTLGFVLNKPKTTSVSASKLRLERLEIANITNNSVSIFWRTKEKEASWLIYGEDERKLNKQIFDDRDLADNKNSYFNHYAIFKNLQPNKKYFFEIVTTKGVIRQNNNSPFIFVTKTQLPLSSSLPPAMGSIQGRNGRPLINGIILLKIEGAGLLSDRTKDKGEWLIPFYYLTKIDTDELIQPKVDSSVTIEVISEEGEMSTVKTIVKKTSPLPQTVIIGKNYEFNDEKEKVLSETTKGQLSFGKIDIIFPKENAAIDAKKPNLRGTALPHKKVKIIIESLPTGRQAKTPQIFEIYADKDGVWNSAPFYDLDPGKHQLTIITEDENNKEVKITRIFNILKSGESVLGEATPSGTITPTEMPTDTPVPTTPPVTSTPVVSVTQPAPKPGINFFPLTVVSTVLMILGTGLIMIF